VFPFYRMVGHGGITQSGHPDTDPDSDQIAEAKTMRG
jgi:hypothetical protein